MVQLCETQAGAVYIPESWQENGCLFCGVTVFAQPGTTHADAFSCGACGEKRAAPNSAIIHKWHLRSLISQCYGLLHGEKPHPNAASKESEKVASRWPALLAQCVKRGRGEQPRSDAEGFLIHQCAMALQPECLALLLKQWPESVNERYEVCLSLTLVAHVLVFPRSGEQEKNAAALCLRVRGRRFRSQGLTTQVRKTADGSQGGPASRGTRRSVFAAFNVFCNRTMTAVRPRC